MHALALPSDIALMEILVVGDTPCDVQAAAKCGFAKVALPSGGLRRRAAGAGAIPNYDDVAELLADYDG